MGRDRRSHGVGLHAGESSGAQARLTLGSMAQTGKHWTDQHPVTSRTLLTKKTDESIQDQVDRGVDAVTGDEVIGREEHLVP